jgi:hypothetical protein
MTLAKISQLCTSKTKPLSNCLLGMAQIKNMKTQNQHQDIGLWGFLYINKIRPREDFITQNLMTPNF